MPIFRKNLVSLLFIFAVEAVNKFCNAFYGLFVTFGNIEG